MSVTCVPNYVVRSIFLYFESEINSNFLIMISQSHSSQEILHKKGHTDMNHWVFELSLEQYFPILGIDSLHYKLVTAILSWDLLENKI